MSRAHEAIIESATAWIDRMESEHGMPRETAEAFVQAVWRDAFEAGVRHADNELGRVLREKQDLVDRELFAYGQWIEYYGEPRQHVVMRMDDSIARRHVGT
jgi:hypothetical protein